MASVIIPAHNEESVIGRCIAALAAGSSPGEFEIIVACNGCTDGTARAAASHPGVRVLDLPSPSKPEALNAGDAAAGGYPRIYLDADVELTSGAARRLVTALGEGPHLAAAPRRQIDLQGASAPVRAFYRMWDATPYVQEGMIGCGVYALSQAGRARFDRFPAVIADDGYVRTLFAPDERITTNDRVLVHAPRTFTALLRARTRSRLGLYELRMKFPDRAAAEQATKSYGSALRGALKSPSLWLPAVVYLTVNLLARLRAARQLRDLERYRWERDETTR